MGTKSCFTGHQGYPPSLRSATVERDWPTLIALESGCSLTKPRVAQVLFPCYLLCRVMWRATLHHLLCYKMSCEITWPHMVPQVSHGHTWCPRCHVRTNACKSLGVQSVFAKHCDAPKGDQLIPCSILFLGILSAVAHFAFGPFNGNVCVWDCLKVC